MKLCKWIGLALFIASSAQAYIPPSEFMIRETVKKRQGFKGFRVRVQVNLLRDGKPVGAGFKEILSLDYASRTLRSRAQDQEGKDLYLAERKLDGTQNPLAGPTRVLLENNSANLVRFLKASGIPIKSEGELLQMETEAQRRSAEVGELVRLGPAGAYAWTIGRPPKAGIKADPQVWIEKDNFVPARLVLAAADVRFSAYRLFQEMPYPKTIETSSLRAETLEASTQVDPSEAKSVITFGFTEAGNSLDSETRDLIQQYYAVIR